MGFLGAGVREERQIGIVHARADHRTLAEEKERRSFHTAGGDMECSVGLNGNAVTVARSHDARLLHADKGGAIDLNGGANERTFGGERAVGNEVVALGRIKRNGAAELAAIFGQRIDRHEGGGGCALQRDRFGRIGGGSGTHDVGVDVGEAGRSGTDEIHGDVGAAGPAGIDRKSVV